LAERVAGLIAHDDTVHERDDSGRATALIDVCGAAAQAPGVVLAARGAACTQRHHSNENNKQNHIYFFVVGCQANLSKWQWLNGVWRLAALALVVVVVVAVFVAVQTDSNTHLPTDD
jgi:hypothetical protein